METGFKQWVQCADGKRVYNWYAMLLFVIFCLCLVSQLLNQAFAL